MTHQPFILGSSVNIRGILCNLLTPIHWRLVFFASWPQKTQVINVWESINYEKYHKYLQGSPRSKASESYNGTEQSKRVITHYCQNTAKSQSWLRQHYTWPNGIGLGPVGCLQSCRIECSEHTHAHQCFVDCQQTFSPFALHSVSHLSCASLHVC
jgi:hypothetical protein